MQTAACLSQKSEADSVNKEEGGALRGREGETYVEYSLCTVSLFLPPK